MIRTPPRWHPIHARNRRGGGSSIAVRYLQQHDFTVSESAPAVSPLVGEQDSLVLVQTGNNISIADGKLVLPGHNTQAACGAYGSTARARTVGRVYLTEITLDNSTGYGLFGLVNSAAITYGTAFGTMGGIEFGGGFTPGLIKRVSSVSSETLGVFSPLTPYRVAIVTRATGGFVLIKGGAWPAWQILHMIFEGSETNLRVAFSNLGFGLAAGAKIGFVRLPDNLTWVPTPFVNDGMTGATSDGTGIVEVGGSGATRDTTHGSLVLGGGNLMGTLGASPAYAIATYNPANATADAFVGAHVSCGTDTGISLALRVTDKDNCWLVRLNNAEVKLQIVERNAGVEIVRATVDELAVGDAEFTLTAYAKGQTITVYTDHGITCEYTSAAMNVNETRHGVVFEGATAVVRDYFAFPINPTVPACFDF